MLPCLLPKLRVYTPEYLVPGAAGTYEAIVVTFGPIHIPGSFIYLILFLCFETISSTNHGTGTYPKIPRPTHVPGTTVQCVESCFYFM